MKLEELVEQARSKGIEVSFVPDISGGKNEIMALLMTGIPSQQIGFNLEAFVKSLVTEVEDCGFKAMHTLIEIEISHMKQIQSYDELVKSRGKLNV